MRRTRETKKNYKWLAIFTTISWILGGLMIYFVDPENLRDVPIDGAYLLPGLMIWLAIFLLLTIILGKAKRGLWWSLGVIIFLYLRIWGVGGILNGVLLLGLLVVGQIYELMQRKDKKEVPGQESKEPL